MDPRWGLIPAPSRLLGNFPGGPVVKISPFTAGVQVQSLVGELRSHMPRGQKTKKTEAML